VTPQAVSTVDKTLLRYLLPRLATAGSTVALPLAGQLIRERPDELRSSLQYLGVVDPASEIAAEIPDLLSYDGYRYDYTVFLTLRWMWQYRITNDALLQFARAVLSEGTAQPWTRGYATAVLGRWGAATDLEHLMNVYDGLGADLDRAELICSASRVESGRRNAFLAQVAPGSMWTEWAAAAVRNQVLDGLLTPHQAGDVLLTPPV